MIPVLIKLFSISLCAIYTFSKLLNVWKPSASNIILDAIFSIFISFAAYLTGIVSPFFVIPTMFVILVVYNIFRKKTLIGLTITSVIISLGISYSVFFLSGFIISFLFALIQLNPSDNQIYPMVFFSLLQFLLIGIPYRFRRLKKGMPFLINKGGTFPGVSISIVLLYCIVIVFNKEQIFILNISIITITSCASLIIFWWRKNLNRLYLKRIKENELQGLHESLKEKDARITYLEQQNNELSKIIHKDNKLIPAMEMAVKSYLQESVKLDKIELQEKGYELLSRLEDMSKERSGILDAYQTQGKRLPSTKVISLDALMAYMLKKAYMDETVLDLTVTGSIKYMVENIISEADMNTLLADLIENALIAVRKSSLKKILVSLGIVNDTYVVSVFDSGEPFAAEVLTSFGQKKITTHAHEGGNGIGLMTLYDIILKYNASFIIDELIPHGSGYAKEVSVKLDQLGKYVVNTSDIKKTEIISS
jgi:hypothetical protein